MTNLNERVDFESRHIGPNEFEVDQMLQEIGTSKIAPVSQHRIFQKMLKTRI